MTRISIVFLLVATTLVGCTSEAIKKNIDRNLGREASTEVLKVAYDLKCENSGNHLELKYDVKAGTHSITAKFPSEKTDWDKKGLCFFGTTQGSGFFLLDLRQTVTCYEDSFTALKQRTSLPQKPVLSTAVISTTAVEEKQQKSKTIYRSKTESALQIKDTTGKALATFPVESCAVDEL